MNLFPIKACFINNKDFIILSNIIYRINKKENNLTIIMISKKKKLL